MILVKRLSSLFLTLTLLFTLTACGGGNSSADVSLNALPGTQPSSTERFEPSASSADSSQATTPTVEEGEYYYDLEHVVLYLDAFGELPDNYITKKEATSLGWQGGTTERYLEGSAIGGDYFGNRQGTLPEGKYTECDLNTNGQKSRGAERLVFSKDGHYYYTEDHYETFTQVWVENGEVTW